MRLLPILLMVCLFGVQTAVAAGDPFLATWSLDPKASRYASGDCPASMIIVMKEVANGIHYFSVTTQLARPPVSAEYTADYEGHLAMIVGNAGLMSPISIKRVGDRTVEVSYMRGFKQVAFSRRVVTHDSRTLIITTTFKDASGRNVTNIGIYKKLVDQNLRSGMAEPVAFATR